MHAAMEWKQGVIPGMCRAGTGIKAGLFAGMCMAELCSVLNRDVLSIVDFAIIAVECMQGLAE